MRSRGQSLDVRLSSTYKRGGTWVTFLCLGRLLVLMGGGDGVSGGLQVGGQAWGTRQAQVIGTDGILQRDNEGLD